MADKLRHSSQKIIGRGTWYDKTAAELVEREKGLGRSLDLIRTESGLGASGFPHIGSLGDALRNYAVSMAVNDLGYNSELVAFSDDKDGLRRVPAGLPDEMKRWLGYPVSSIPDIFGDCHESFGFHMTSLLLEALDISGAEYKFMSGTEVYNNGILNEEILTIMDNSDKIGKIIKEEIGQEKYTEILPYFPVCDKCGRIYTTSVYKYVNEEHKALYKCEGMEVKGTWLEGCGFDGEVDVLKGNGKLSWKVEFAARWRALDIRFEAYGKDIADSVRVNDRICKEILDYEPPMHVQYEMFLDRGGAKISKSAGNVFTPQVWYKYGSPQSLNLLIFKRFVGTKSGSVDVIPSHMDELDELEDLYFGKKKIRNKMEIAKLRGLYEYCWMLKPPQGPSIHVPYNLMINLVKVAPKGSEDIFIREKLRDYGILDNGDNQIDDRINYALSWLEDFRDVETKKIILSDVEIKAIQKLIHVIKDAYTEEDFQGSIFMVSKDLEIHPRSLFRIVYQILLGKSHGPRFGPLVTLVGKDHVIKEFENTILKN